MLSVNGIGVQRCNASITAMRYCSRSLSSACSDSQLIRGWPRISPARLKLTTTVMSMGLAREGGGGFQQLKNLANASRMVLTCSEAASTLTGERSNSAAAKYPSRSRRRNIGSLDVGSDLHLQHLVRIGHRAAGRSGRRLFQLVDHIHSRHDFTDHGVLAVQARRIAKHEEELRIGR